MFLNRRVRHAVRTLLLLGFVASPALQAQTVQEPASPARFETLTLRGKVVWLSEALARRHGISEVREAAERVLVLESSEGTIYPLIEDLRGRSFRLDPRLRAMDVELVVRRHTGSPFVQVLRIVEVRNDGKYIVDYWCDICSIVMYELKECDCCQGPTVLRKTPVEREGR